MLKRLMRDQRLHRDTPTAVSILLFTESSKPSGIFPKKMPPRMNFRWKHMNRNRSNTIACMNLFRALTAFVLLSAWQSALAAQDASLHVSGAFVLTKASDGFEGKLELVLDARITSDLEKALWRMGPPEMVLGEKDLLAKDLAARPLRNAVLRLRDANQKVVSEKALDGPLTRIRFAALIPGRRTILATTDLSAGFGSYSGPNTELFQVSNGKLEQVTAQEAASGSVAPIYVAETLKTDWKLVPATGGPASQKDILEAACRPDFDSPTNAEQKFWIIYTRYHWDGKQWTKSSRREHGFWEAEEHFPTLASFPAPATEAKK